MGMRTARVRTRAVAMVAVLSIMAGACSFQYRDGINYRADINPLSVDITLRQRPSWQIVWLWRYFKGDFQKVVDVLWDLDIGDDTFKIFGVGINGVGIAQWKKGLSEERRGFENMVGNLAFYQWGVDKDTNTDCGQLTVDVLNRVSWHIKAHPESDRCQLGEFAQVKA